MGHDFIETRDLLAELCANAADKYIIIRRHRSQEKRRPIFDLSVRLWNRRENNIPLIHRLD